MLDRETDTLDIDPDEGQPPTVLTFALGEQIFAVDVHRVREILDSVPIRPLPGAPHDVLGMIDLRGQSVAILDLASRIGLHGAGRDGGRIVVFEVVRGGQAVALGALADRVLRVCELAGDALEPVPQTLSGWRSEAATGVLRGEDGTALMLDIDALLGGADRPGPFDFD